jgi:hypothetical protein
MDIHTYVYLTVHVLDKHLANFGILMDMGISIKKTNRESTYKVLEALVCHPVAISLLLEAQCCRFCDGTLVIILNGEPLDTINSYSDAEWAGDKATRRSTSGTITFLNSSPICWGSKSQKCVSLSTMESELVAMTSRCQDALWLKNIIGELLPHVKPAIKLHCDNLPALKHSSSLSSDSMTRHISLRYHFIRNLCSNGLASLNHVSGKINPADMFTKSLGTNHLSAALNMIHLRIK